MQITTLLRHCFVVAWSALDLLLIISPASAYKPEDPQVRAMVDRGVQFLEGLSVDQLKQSRFGGGDAQVVLAAYAHYKAEHNLEAPLVKLGITHAEKYTNAIKNNGGEIAAQEKTIYEVAVVVLFLAEVDSNVYAKDLRMLIHGLFSLQKPDGGFGYPDYEAGDISQVQYISLAAWTLDRAGIDLPLDRVAEMLAWNMRVQDVSGAWPYQAADPGLGRGPIQQARKGMSVTMCLAGGSCALIAGDIFRIWENTIVAPHIEGLPRALRPVAKSSVLDARRQLSPIKSAMIVAALRKMEGYRSANPYDPRHGHYMWYYYMLYTLERYESFIELANGKPSPNDWYDANVTYLMQNQDDSGSWGVKDQASTPVPVSTSFAILFLTRSTQKAIGNVSSGSMAGGFGLPKDTANVQFRGTKAVVIPVAGSLESMLDLLEADGANDIETKSIPEDLKLESDPQKRAAQLDRLTRLVRRSRSWQARRVAARLLGASDDPDMVPVLILALSDDDRLVRANAMDSLNFISRRMDIPPLSDQANEAEILAAQNAWFHWYQSIRPDFEPSHMRF